MKLLEWIKEKLDLEEREVNETEPKEFDLRREAIFNRIFPVCVRQDWIEDEFVK